MEEWKDIPEYEGIYQASTLGRIRGLDRQWIDRAGMSRTYKGKIKAQMKTQCKSDVGYWRVNLCKNWKVHTHMVHKLIMLTFVGPRPANMEILHINGDTLDSRLINLRYGTKNENMRDRDAHGKTARGSRSGASKLTNDEIIRIRQERMDGSSVLTLAHKYNVSPSSISSICNKKSWAWL